MTEILTTDVTIFGETRPVEFRSYGDRFDSREAVVIGRFPTGTKIHVATLTLWKRNMSTGRPLRGATAAVVNGEEYVADFSMNTHNSNRGRITGWNDLAFDSELVAKWGRAW